MFPSVGWKLFISGCIGTGFLTSVFPSQMMKNCQRFCFRWLNCVTVNDAVILWIKEKAHTVPRLGLLTPGWKSSAWKGMWKLSWCSEVKFPKEKTNFGTGLAATLYTKIFVLERYAIISQQWQIPSCLLLPWIPRKSHSPLLGLPENCW